MIWYYVAEEKLRRKLLFVDSQKAMHRAPISLTSRVLFYYSRFKPTLLAVRCMSDLPYHIVVGMPALSPTMEAGTLAEWNVKEGEGFKAGDSLAKIDTDKASIDFEAQDDGFVAKLLIPNNTEDVTVGSPIMVTVEEEEHVSAFADFVAPESSPAAEAEPLKEEKPAVAASAPPPPPSPPAEAAAPQPPLPAVEEPVIAAAAAPAEFSSAPTMGPAWGTLAKVSSPLAKTLASEQRKYVDNYGTTGQVPL
jgi:pyruvate dehydrogenase E2 component (dihydrolipoamide acetyltransferase)